MDSGVERIRVRLDLAYDGTDFFGWAAQPGLRTVEGELAAGLRTVLRVEESVRLTVAGRTDAGVHARGQVAHCDVPGQAWRGLPDRRHQIPGQSLVSRLRAVLPKDVVVRRAAPAPPGFDARFSAFARRYLYRICDQASALDPLRRHDVLAHRRRLDVTAMDQASQRLHGLHDFAAYCRRRDGATTVRTLLRYQWARHGDGLLEATVVADAFCHSMVRALVGAAVGVGEGRYAVGVPREVLDAGQRDPRVVVMPAHGLSLEEVAYPPDSELGVRAEQARAVRSLET